MPRGKRLARYNRSITQPEFERAGRLVHRCIDPGKRENRGHSLNAPSLCVKLEHAIVPLCYHDQRSFMDTMAYSIAINGSFFNKQFNQETIQTKQQRNCGEPCAAVCKKMHGRFKKDYEPHQTMGPLCGIFDQRAAEQLNHHAAAYEFWYEIHKGIHEMLREYSV